MIIYISIIIATIIILPAIYFLFYVKKKIDEKDSKELKSINNKQQNIILNKKSKKKSGKKPIQNDSESINIENDKNETVAEDSTEIREEIIIESIKIKEEMTAPTKENEKNSKNIEEINVSGSKKKNKKSKYNSGDQFSMETEKNYNQSNTLLGRNTDEKLKEEIQNLLKKLDDLQKEKDEMEATSSEKVMLIQIHENKIEDLNGELKKLTLTMNKLKSDMDNEKSKSNQLSMDKSKISKEIEEVKCQMIIDNTAHKDMYNKYENKIEDLNDQVKKMKLEEVKLSKELNVEIKKSKDIQQKFDEIHEMLSKRITELKLKEGDILKLQEVNDVLKKSVKDLEKSLHNTSEEFKKKHFIECKENERLKVVVEGLNSDLCSKSRDLEESVESESNLVDKASALNEKIQKIEKEFIIMETDLKAKINKLTENNTNLQLTVKTLHEEMETKAKDVTNVKELYEKELELLRISSRDKEEEMKKLLAFNESEFVTKNKTLEEQSSEIEASIKALETTINVKDREIEQFIKTEEESKDMISALNDMIEELKKDCSSAEKVFQLKFEESDQSNNKLKEIINLLQKEIEETKKNECSLLDKVSCMESLTEQLQKATALKEDFDKKMKDLHELNTHLQIIIHDQKKEIEEKNSEMDILKGENYGLSNKISSINVDFEVLRQSSNSKAESAATNSTNDEALVKELNDKLEEMSKELTCLKVDLGKKEAQVEDLIVNASVLLSEKKSLEKNLSGIIEKLQTQVIKLMVENKTLENERSDINVINEDIIPEIKVELSNESPSHCPDDHSQYIFEVDKLKYHIKKLESELVQMQGRYFQLKEDSTNVTNGAKRHNQNIISETVLVSFPPVTVDSPVQSMEQVDENRASTHDSLQEAINRLNSEIEEQRLTNQKLSGDLQSKQKEVNNLKQCLVGLDGSLNNIGDMENELQKTCSEKKNVKCQPDTFIMDHEVLTKKYVDLEKRWTQLNESIQGRCNDDDEESKNKMNILYDENHQLKFQLEQYRDSLEKTEQMLEKIQLSVDKEETQWTSALKSSELENNKLELAVKELSKEIEELKNRSSLDLSDTVASISTINNGTAPSETKKKRKRRNKNKNKKKKKNLGLPEANGT